ncbi:glycosyltransferase family 4 protein [Spirilliplanes yamanashiensis]|uniref:Glycosyl transferase n=1 Tax=Spirilliplanes yamanashiensis TaxID=42233 RepID=A0A8J3YCE7_9ACTN|nr:glycosyltransferase family 4 protein [Spirilliplanes yamanashiensis]MDP9819069.1 glycosyltransferase involved in cell wall biosynthesis [Spirilliplanes yamanashiensis]GIJ05524.1 glycosyl transferase [Spirilliplanes yamanashiensis]
MTDLHVVLPGDVDDPAAPSGGNRYDREVCRRLTGAGWVVREHAVAGSWPFPDTGTRTALAAALAEVPDGGLVLLDGLAACAAPDVVAPEAKRLRPVVLVHLPLGDETGLSPADAALLTAREAETLRAAAGVVATSAAAARRLAQLHGLTGVAVAEPGVDPAPAAQPSPGGTRLLCVAAVTPRKGHDVLLDALGRLGGLDWECRCVGAAASPWARELRDPTGRVVFAGPRTGAELAAEYAAADLLVLPSRAETYGMVVTEALARAVPVVASAADGVPEALGMDPRGARPGLLVPPGDPAALTAALRRWLTEPDLRRDLRAAAAGRRATLTGWDTTARRITDILQETR